MPSETLLPADAAEPAELPSYVWIRQPLPPPPRRPWSSPWPIRPTQPAERVRPACPALSSRALAAAASPDPADTAARRQSAAQRHAGSPRRRGPVQPPGPPPATVARRWANAVVETLNGRRPYAQLAGRCAPTVLAQLSRHAPAYRAAGGAQLASLRVQAARPGRLEVCLRLRLAGRGRAAAFGLAWRGGQWHADELVIG